MPDGSISLKEIQSNPAKWKKTPGVVLFRAHTRQTENGEIKVTEDDLTRIARDANREIMNTGKLTTFTIGHRKFGEVNETEQPPLVGTHLNFRVENVTRGGKTFKAMIADEYAMTDKAVEYDLYRQFPFRSGEFHPVNGFCGVAALQQEPWLKLGTVLHYRADNPPYKYSSEPIAMDEMDDVPPEAYAMFQKCMARYMAEAGATNSSMPGDEQDPNQAAGMAKYQADLALKDQEIAKERQRANQAVVKALLEPLKGRFAFTYQLESDRMCAMATDADRQKHVTYMQANYKPLPGSGNGGEMIQIGELPKDKPTTYAAPSENILAKAMKLYQSGKFPTMADAMKEVTKAA